MSILYRFLVAVLAVNLFPLVSGGSIVRADVIPVFKLDGRVGETPPELAALFGQARPKTLGEWVSRMKRAAEDPNVPVVALLVESPILGTAQIQELSDAMQRLRQAGKDVHVFAESLTISTYLLCTGASEITLVPAGHFLSTGINPTSMYVRGLLDKIGVVPELVHIGDYKTAGETYMRTGPSKEALAQMNRIIDDLYGQAVRRVSDARDLSLEQAEEALTSGPCTAEQALKAGLIDSVHYRKDFLSRLQRRYGAELKADYGKTSPFDFDLSTPFALFQLFSDLMKEAQATLGQSIAIVHVEGLILEGKSADAGLLGKVAGSKTLRKALEEAAEDASVRAVVLRVDSPGGSALASEIIWKGTQRVREAKPLIVSMGNVAASGGYYVSCGADKIFADPGTVTGSIGVLGGKFVTRGMWNKIGVTWHESPRGRHATLFSPSTPFSDEQREVVRRFMDATYDTFKARVTDGRGSRIRGDLEPLAGGRVYTGRQALEIGLVDELGGLHEALAHAAKLAGLTEYEVRVLPGPKTLMDLLEELFGLDEDADISAATADLRVSNPMLGAALPFLGSFDPQRTAAIVRSLRLADLLNREGVIAVMPFELILP